VGHSRPHQFLLSCLIDNIKTFDFRKLRRQRKGRMANYGIEGSHQKIKSTLTIPLQEAHDFSRNRVSGGRAIAETLKGKRIQFDILYLSQLRLISFSGDHIGLYRGNTIAEALKVNKTLTSGEK